MDKYEYKVRAEEIKELIAQGDYGQAAEIADTIDWRRVKSVMMLCTISDLYKINRRFEDARDMLLLAYERRPGGRTICYSLCELSIKMEDYIQAIEYYKEFVQAAPTDVGRYILQYKLYEAQDVSLEERIQVLEELKKKEYREKWVYELAYLYHRIGLGTRCVEECDELILYFGEGKYVIKAMELKMLHEPLTPIQQKVYDNRFARASAYQEQSGRQEAAVQDAGYAGHGAYNGNTYGENAAYEGQAAYGENAGYEGQAAYGESTGYEGQAAYGENAGYEGQAAYGESTGYEGQDAYGESTGYEGNAAYAGEYSPMQQESVAEHVPQEREEMDIHVKTMDVGQYNTINLQEELAAGLREVLGDTHKPDGSDAVTQAILAPMLETDTESLDYPQIEEINEEDLDLQQEEMEASEIFFGETGEIGQIQREAQTVTEDFLTEEPSEEVKTVPDITAEIVMEQMRKESSAISPEEILTAQPPKELAEVLSQESDGQISLVVPESESIEKQITGQMSIEDILAEWERMKKENEEKRKEEVRQHVLEQTGSMFTEFEAAVRDGLLEQLENGSVTAANTDMELEADTDLEPEADVDLEPAAEAEAYAETEAGADTDLEPAAELEADAEEAEIEEADEKAYTQDAVQEESCELEAGEESTEEIAEELVEETAEEIAEEAPAETEEYVPVERDKAKVRPLTREEKELYGPFIQSKSAREQLVKTIDSISMAAFTGNVIITGEEGMDTLTLAKNIIREVQMTDSNFSGKVAKISGQALNNKDVASVIGQLKNGALIIQKPSGINAETAKALHKSLQKENMGIIVLLEDTKKAINRFLQDNPFLQENFNARMDVEALNNDTLVAFGKQYAREMEYAIDELGILALHTRIADLQTIDHVVTVVEVKEIVDDAIRHANKKSLGHFFDILFAKRYDDEDMIILSEKDFVY